MIYTVTFNPSLDYIVSVDDFKLGLTNRTSSELILPGGKGTNVSTVLKKLGFESTALGFVAGWIEKQDYEYAFHMGVASGSASAFSENLATKEEIINVYNQVMGK